MKTRILLSALLFPTLRSGSSLRPSFFFCLFTFIFYLGEAQVPQGFNYQAIARDATGTVIFNKSIPIRLTLRTSLTGDTIIYEETFSSVKTDQYGMISLVVGTGTQTGGTAALFSAIDWKARTLFLKTEVQYPGTTWTTMGTTQIWAVPYSLVAKDVQGPLTSLGINGTSTYTADSALFEVKNKDGNTVFAVYNEGVRVYVSNETKGLKSGFAVGGFGTDKGTSQPFLVVNEDSARIYVNSNTSTKGLKGGFAVGGYDMTKGTVQDYLNVSPDSVRIYIDSNPSTKGSKSGFAVGGYDMTKGGVVQYLSVTNDSTRIITADTLKGFGVSNLSSGNTEGYLRLTPSNYLIGHQAGSSITTGLYNSVLGYESGYSLRSGASNSFMGYKAGYFNTSGNYNVFIGNNAGFLNNGSMNTFVGFISGQNNQTGYYNTFVGDSSGFSNSSGFDNTFLGGRAGCSNSTGYFNMFAGSQAGYRNSTGSYNTAFGASALYSNTKGSGNVANGTAALYSNTTGIQNTAIGMYALLSDTSGNGNVAVGSWTLADNTSGSWNVANGVGALWYNTTGSLNVANGCNTLTYNTTGWDNVANGYSALTNNTTGSGNNATGCNALTSNTTGSENIAIGESALQLNTTGSSNTVIGWRAGYNTITGNSNVFIGYQAGYNESGSNKLYIANSSTSTPLIGGDFSSLRVGINRMPTTYTFEVGGTIWANGATISAGATTWSDARYKTNVTPIDNALEDVLRLQGVKFDWRRSDFPDLNFPQGSQLGVIAQDVEKVLPQLVYSGPDGYKSVSYEKLTPVLIEAIKDQQKQIESYKSQIQSLQAKVDHIEAMLEKGGGQ